jgi:tripartite-type tricarboxylate transporter receptor subunit TctC
MAIHIGRRAFIAGFGGTALGWPIGASAQTAGSGKPIRMVVGFGAAGTTDIAARVLSGKLSKALGQQVYVDNRTGAGGTIATEQVALAAPDGLTLLMTPLANAANETLFKNFRYTYEDYFTAVAPVADTNNVVVAHPSLHVKTIGELIALAKSRPPGAILAGSPGVGTASHLANELFNQMTGIKMTSVQYRGGGDVMKDLVSGQIKVDIAPIPTVLPFLKNDSVLALATTGLKRDPMLPDVPTVIESGVPGFDVRLWIGILAPKATPRPVVERIAGATAQALTTPDLKAAYAAQGLNPLPGGPNDFAAFYRSEVAKWRKVIVATGMSLE